MTGGQKNKDTFFLYNFEAQDQLITLLKRCGFSEQELNQYEISCLSISEREHIQILGTEMLHTKMPEMRQKIENVLENVKIHFTGKQSGIDSFKNSLPENSDYKTLWKKLTQSEKNFHQKIAEVNQMTKDFESSQ